jgi:DNA polymerase-1
MPDFDQMEFLLMLDRAAVQKKRPTELIKKILGGLDVHQATADVASQGGNPITRNQAKTVNFLTLYGGGNAKLAAGLGCSLATAKKIRNAIFDAAPEIPDFIDAVCSVASSRQYVFNWAGRRCHFPNSEFAYRAPNYVIQGGCADIVKIAMNRIDDFLLDKRSKMLLTIHDELVIEVHFSELETVPKRVKEIMETVYPAQYLPLTCSMEHSFKSLGDKVKGFPTHDSGLQ